MNLQERVQHFDCLVNFSTIAARSKQRNLMHGTTIPCTAGEQGSLSDSARPNVICRGRLREIFVGVTLLCVRPGGSHLGGPQRHPEESVGRFGSDGSWRRWVGEGGEEGTTRVMCFFVRAEKLSCFNKTRKPTSTTCHNKTGCHPS